MIIACQNPEITGVGFENDQIDIETTLQPAIPCTCTNSPSVTLNLMTLLVY